MYSSGTYTWVEYGSLIHGARWEHVSQCKMFGLSRCWFCIEHPVVGAWFGSRDMYTNIYCRFVGML